MMDNKQEIRRIWNERWKGSREKEGLSFIARLMFRAKKEAIKSILANIKIENMIEVGCGLGHTLSIFKEKGISCVGIDISEQAIAVCKDKGLKVRLEALEGVAEKYELVSSDGLIEHFLDFPNYARQLMRISLKYVLLIQPNHTSFAGRTAAYLSGLLKNSKNVYEYNYRIEDFIGVFTSCGFRLLTNNPIFINVFRLLLFER